MFWQLEKLSSPAQIVFLLILVEKTQDFLLVQLPNTSCSHTFYFFFFFWWEIPPSKVCISKNGSYVLEKTETIYITKAIQVFSKMEFGIIFGYSQRSRRITIYLFFLSLSTRQFCFQPADLFRYLQALWDQ